MSQSKRELEPFDSTETERYFSWMQEDGNGQFEIVTRQDLEPSSIDFELPRQRCDVGKMIYRRGNGLEFNLMDFLPEGFTATYFPGRASRLKVGASDKGDVLFEDLTTQQELFGLFHALGHANIWHGLSDVAFEERHHARNAVLLGDRSRGFVNALMDEYEAWQWALVNIANLRRRNIDIFPGVNQDQFHEWIAQSRQLYGCVEPEQFPSIPEGDNS